MFYVTTAQIIMTFVFQFEFVAVACTSSKASESENQSVMRSIQENGWRADAHIRHVTSQSANEIILKPYDQCKWNHSKRNINYSCFLPR